MAMLNNQRVYIKWILFWGIHHGNITLKYKKGTSRQFVSKDQISLDPQTLVKGHALFITATKEEVKQLMLGCIMCYSTYGWLYTHHIALK